VAEANGVDVKRGVIVSVMVDVFVGVLVSVGVFVGELVRLLQGCYSKKEPSARKALFIPKSECSWAKLAIYRWPTWDSNPEPKD
jgi:hypothetical protein